VSDARTEILARIASAGAAPAPPPARRYRTAGARTDMDRTDLFAERVSEYRADVRRVEAGAVAEAAAAICREQRVRRLGVPAGVPREWLPDGVEIVTDAGLGPRDLDALDGVLTGCAVAIAETGTIALAGGTAEGRRALTLVPDLHICVVEARQVVELVPEAIGLLAARVREEGAAITLVSGPSATSDIELKRVEGVHGPRRLAVLIAFDSPRSVLQSG
jgi:L-lactate dehydrogenase complex protein LldG